MSYPLLFVLLCLAAYRVWRFFALDTLPPLVAARDNLQLWVADRHGDDWADGLACVWCSGWWVCCAVVGITWSFVPLPMPGLWFLSVSAAVGLLGMKLED